MKDQSATRILGTTIEKIKDLVDTSTIIGEPIKISDRITVVPISKVTYGFASGGSDFPSKKSSGEFFGGGGGAGITVSPVAFLVVNGDVVTVRNIGGGSESTVEKVVTMVPELVNTISGLVDKYVVKKEDTDEQAIEEAINGND